MLLLVDLKRFRLSSSNVFKTWNNTVLYEQYEDFYPIRNTNPSNHILYKNSIPIHAIKQSTSFFDGKTVAVHESSNILHTMGIRFYDEYISGMWPNFPHHPQYLQILSKDS